MIAWWQILLLTLYAGYQIMDELNWYTCAGSAVFSGMITGLIMGDLQTGLFIGGSMQLTVLGVGTFGGASRIDANSGTLVATAFAVGAGMNPETALAAIGVPVAAILVYTDIAGRFANTFFGVRCRYREDELGRLQRTLLARCRFLDVVPHDSGLPGSRIWPGLGRGHHHRP